MIKVIVIGKLKNANEEWKDFSTRVDKKRAAIKPEGLIDYWSEIKNDVEITVSTWKTWDNALVWSDDPIQEEFKKRRDEWYVWTKALHIEGANLTDPKHD
jgi:hypothetical protein